MPVYHSASGSVAEDLFIELFSDTFGAEKAGYLYSQYHFYDIYQNSRYADFVLENGVLYNQDKTNLIHYTISKKDKEFIVPSGVICLGKHCFFACDNFTILYQKEIL